jgi:hypothetical protein
MRGEHKTALVRDLQLRVLASCRSTPDRRRPMPFQLAGEAQLALAAIGLGP